MKNPNGPYPGRQLFLGLTKDEKPAFAYLVTGRSPQSRERKAATKENSIIMGPIGKLPYDPLRHYTAVKYDSSIGLLAVSNGIQTEAIYETYKLLLLQRCRSIAAELLIIPEPHQRPTRSSKPHFLAVIPRVTAKDFKRILVQPNVGLYAHFQ